MRISRDDLVKKLQVLDQRLVNIWLDDNPGLQDEELWELFVLLLESRVELLKVCKDAGINLTADECCPAWLEKLVESRKEIRVRELKLMQNERHRQQLAQYQKQSRKEVDSE